MGFGQQAQQGAQAFGAPSTGFGGQTTTPAFGSTSTFGSTTSPGFSFGQTAPGQSTTAPSIGFGQASGFGQTAGFGQTSGFGAQGFGQSTTLGQPTGFGQATGLGQSPGFGQTAGFGQPSATPGFGGGSNVGFGLSGGSGFGAQPASQFGSTTGFGAGALGSGQSTPSAFGATPLSGSGAKLGFNLGGTSGFGQQQTSFGQTPSGTGFGQPQFGGGFGSTMFSQPSLQFGSPSMGFGQPTSFGTTPQAMSTAQGVSTGQQPQPTAMPEENLYATLGRKLELLKKKKDNLEIHIKKPESSSEGTERSSAYTVVKGASPSSFSKPSPSRGTPLSLMKITPRGFLSQETLKPSSTTPSVLSSDSRGNNASSLLNRSAMRLVLEASRVVKDQTADLPMPPRSSAATPLRTNERLEDESSRGEKTWLTPAATDSPAISVEKQNGTNMSASSNLFTPSTTDIHLSESNQGTAAVQHPPFAHIQSLDPEYELQPPKQSASSESYAPQAESNLAPTLVRTGYLTVPSIAALRSMTEYELEHVLNFTVFRPNIGEIKWAGESDVRRLDLDKIVRIEQNEVIVYEQIEGLKKPPVGQELNKRATITLYNVFPKASASYQKALQFEGKLRKICDDADAEFLYYDSENGEWSFVVDHFSRYGLTEESDDEPETIIQPKSMLARFSSPAAPPMPIREPPESPVTSVILYHHGQDAMDYRDDYTSVLSAIKRRKMSGERLELMDFRQVQRPLKAFVPIDESPCMAILMDIKNEIFSLRNMQPSSNVYTSLHGTGLSDGKKRPMNGIILASWRSFRVGWHPNGSIVHCGQPVFNTDPDFGSFHRIYIEKVNPLAWTQRINTTHRIVDGYIDDETSPYRHSSFAMDAVLRACHCEVGPIPLWRMPSAVSENLDEYLRFATLIKDITQSFSSAVRQHGSRHPELVSYQCMKLMDASCGQESLPLTTSALMPLFDDRDGVPYHIWERRREFLAVWTQEFASWYVKIADLAVELGDAHDNDTYDRIFQLLSCRKVSDAVSLAERSGNYRLATLLSQAGVDDTFTSLIGKQLLHWRESGAIETIPQEVLKVYRILGGESLAIYDEESVLSDISWAQSLCVIFNYSCGNASSLSEAIEVLEQAMKSQQVQSPSVSFLNREVDSAIFSLLRVLFKASHPEQVCLCLRPEGFGGDLLDYRHSYLLVTLFEALGLVDADSQVVGIVRQHFISQLTAVGEWHWAVFVALQQSDQTRREWQTKSLIMQYISQLREGTFDDCIAFLEGALKVPREWIEEALAVSSSDMNDRVKHFISAGCWEDANETICYELTSSWMLASDAAIEPLRDLMELVEGNIDASSSAWRTSGAPLLEYLRIIGEYQRLSSGTAEGVDIAVATNALLSRCESLMEIAPLMKFHKFATADSHPTLGNATLHAVIAHVTRLIDNFRKILTSLGGVIELSVSESFQSNGTLDLIQSDAASLMSRACIRIGNASADSADMIRM